jgi:RNA polymerase sigma-54 factor
VAATGPQVSMDLVLRGRAELRALQGVLHTLEMVPLSQVDIVAQVDKALAENPMLEREDGSPCPSCGRHRVSGGCRWCRGHREPGETAVRPFDTLEADAGCEIRSGCRHALPVVIAHLTERGLLDTEPEEIAALHGIPAETVKEAVRAIKAVGPPGIAETSIAASLHVQARRLVTEGEASPLLEDVVRDHLDAVAADEPGAVNAPRAEVVEAFRLVRTRLRPVALVVPAEPIPRPVDVVVHRGEAGWEVEVPDSRWFGLRRTTVPDAVSADAEAMGWLAKHERAADELVRQLDARANVLRRVCEAAVARQAGYFERGPAGHVPLARTDLAAELGLHASTVSRAVAGKVVRCPDGRIIKLADLFGAAVAVKSRLAELATQRLSDTQLREALAKQGFEVARRTVAKYRAELGIPARGRS